METAKITQLARALYDAHGDKAEAEAAQRARKFEETNQPAEAETWRAIRRSIIQIRGAHES